MFEIADRSFIVSITRGDSAEAPLVINKGTKACPMRYVLDEDDTIYFAIEEPNKPFEFAIVKKVLTKDNLNDHGDVVVKFNPEDTMCLIPGKYFYEAKLRTLKDNKEEVNTIIPKTEFYILE